MAIVIKITHIFLPRLERENSSPIPLFKDFYEGDSISNQPDLFLTDGHSQDFHSEFDHHLSTIGSLFGNLSRLQA